jgi:flagellar biosynthetic protein FlhB
VPQEAAEKRFQPTPRKLQKAREKGYVPRSQELAYLITLAVLILALAIIARHILGWCISSIEGGIMADRGVLEGPEALVRYLVTQAKACILAVGPLLGAMLIAGVVGSIALGGYTISAEQLQFRWEQINPAENIKNLLNTRALVALVIAVAKLLLISLVAWLYLRGQLGRLAALRWAWSNQILSEACQLILGLCIRIGVVLVAVALADTLYQYWRYRQEMMMTVEELKQEQRDTEGSPEVKARLRRIRVAMLMQKIRQEVPKADVVLVNPTHVAVALRYDSKAMDAPTVVAKGAELMAERIRQIATAYGVPIVHRPELARALYSTVQVGQSIPPELYVAVAEVLAMIYRLRAAKRRRKGPIA